MKMMKVFRIFFALILVALAVMACSPDEQANEQEYDDYSLFPSNDLQVKVCNHRWGKEMTFCDNCDALIGSNYMPIIQWYFKYNIKAGLFTNFTYAYEDSIVPLLNNIGVIGASLYCNEIDFSKTDMLVNVSVMRERFNRIIGRYPSTYSYGGAEEGYFKWMTNYFVAGRDNYYGNFGHPYTFYGKDFYSDNYLGSNEEPDGNYRKYQDRKLEMKHYMSIRWCDEAGEGVNGTGGLYNNHYSVEECINKVLEDVNNTYNYHGFYNAFSHWHFLENKYRVKLLEYRDYLNKLRSLPNSKLIHFCGFDEAMEYMAGRMMLKKVAGFVPDDHPDCIKIMGYFDNNLEPPYPIEVINTPVTIYVNTAGTPLENKDIKTNLGNIIKKSNNEYYVELPVAKAGNIMAVLLSENTNGGGYICPDSPVVNATTRDSVITFTVANHPSKVLNFCVFRRDKIEEEDKSQIIGYYLNTNTVIVKKEKDYIYSVGVSANYGKGSYVTMAMSEWK